MDDKYTLVLEYFLREKRLELEVVALLLSGELCVNDIRTDENLSIFIDLSSTFKTKKEMNQQIEELTFFFKQNENRLLEELLIALKNIYV